MEFEEVSMEEFGVVRQSGTASPETVAMREMNAGTVIKFKGEVLSCRYLGDSRARGCSVQGAIGWLNREAKGRRWKLRHEKNTGYHLVACFAVSDNNTG